MPEITKATEETMTVKWGEALQALRNKTQEEEEEEEEDMLGVPNRPFV